MEREEQLCERIFKYIKEHPNCTATDIQKDLKLPHQTVKQYLLVTYGRFYSTKALLKLKPSEIQSLYAMGGEDSIRAGKKGIFVDKSRLHILEQQIQEYGYYLIVLGGKFSINLIDDGASEVVGASAPPDDNFFDQYESLERSLERRQRDLEQG